MQTSATITTGGTSGIGQVNDLVKDASGNIYIAGSQTISGHGLDYCLIKISAAMAIAWQVNYNGSASLDDVANGVRVDASGNVFVTGTSKTTSHGEDYVTLKYNSSGTLQWTQTYNDALNGDDEANAMAIDNSGNIYVTGSAKTDSLNLLNYYTIKYNTSGTQQWAVVTDGDNHLDDKATDIAVDTTGLIVVTGQSALGLPSNNFWNALILFNLGVEFGQITIILLAYFLISKWFSGKVWYRERIVYPVSSIIACVALYWTINRL